MRTIAIALTALGLLGASLAHAAAPHAFVVDDRSVRIVDPSSAESIETIPLREGRQRILFSADLTRMAVFSIPDENEHPATATIVDATTRKKMATIELGWGINDVLPMPDDSIYVLTRGVRSENPSRRRAADFVELDLRTAAVRHRIAFERDAEELDLAPDGKTAIVYMSGDAKGGVPAEFRFIDRTSFEQTAAAKLTPGAGAPIAFRGADEFYSIDTGNHTSGKLFVLSAAGLVGTVGIGGDAKIAAIQPSARRLFLTSRNGDSEGYVEILRDGELEKRVTLNFEPVWFDLSPDARTATISGRTFRGVIGIHGMREASLDLSEMDTASEKPLLVSSLAGARELAAMRLGRALDRCCATLDHSIQVADRIGRAAEILEGSRTAAVLRAGTIMGAMAVAMFSGERIAAHVSEPSLYTDSSAGREAKTVGLTSYFTSRDGRFEYQLDRSEHLLVTSLADRKRIAKIDVDDGLQEMVVLGDERTLVVAGDDRVALIDLGANRRTDLFKAGGDVRDFAVSPDARYGAVIGEDKVTFIQGDAAAVTATVRNIRGTAQVIFVP